MELTSAVTAGDRRAMHYARPALCQLASGVRELRRPAAARYHALWIDIGPLQAASQTSAGACASVRYPASLAAGHSDHTAEQLPVADCNAFLEACSSGVHLSSLYGEEMLTSGPRQTDPPHSVSMGAWPQRGRSREG